MTVILEGPAGKYEWDGSRFLTNYRNSREKWEWDGKLLTNYHNSQIKWEWDGKLLTNYHNSQIKWEWDGKFLTNYHNSREKFEIKVGVPVPIGAVVEGIVR